MDDKIPTCPNLPQEVSVWLASQTSKFYGQEIEGHFEHLYPEMETTVFHWILPDIAHIDVFIQRPNKKNPYYVLFTTGMSEFAMALPDEFQKIKKRLERAELYMFLPKDFAMDQSLKELHSFSLKESWPIHVLKYLASFPHENKTWFSDGHSIGPYNEPIAPDTQQCGCILFQEDGDRGQFITSDNTIINLYCVVPLYKGEIEYRLTHGKQAWHRLLGETGGLSTIIELHRPSLCP